jgi:nicotinamide-nucleotide amidase
MVVEVINTGTELLLGEILNTNFQYLSKALNEKGFDVLYQTTVGDNEQRLCSTIKIALSRADIVVTTGGLGPTRGDITKEIVAAVLEGLWSFISPHLIKLHDSLQIAALRCRKTTLNRR